MSTLIKRDRSIIPACDVDLETHERIVRETASIDGVGAYKIGFQLGLAHGLPKVVEVTRKHTDKPIIYDHQKAGTDIPATGKNFAQTMPEGLDAVIFFPQAGPVTQRAWIEAAQERGLGVIVGGLMTHKGFLAQDGGYLGNDTPERVYNLAAEMQVTNFVVPGNKPEAIKGIRSGIEATGVQPAFFAPGFVAQGGSISEAAMAAGNNWHAIVGRGIYNAKDIQKAAGELTSQL